MFHLLYKWFYDPDTALRFLRLFNLEPLRAFCAAMTAFGLVYFVMPWFIRAMRRAGVSEQARHYSELDAGHKSAVPTMGGLVMLPAIIVSALLWCNPTSAYVLLPLAVGACGGVLGVLDDVAKVRHKGSDHGLARAAKYAAQIAIGAALGVALLSPLLSPIDSFEVAGSFYLPFIKFGYFIGWANVAVVVLFLVISTNAVNLTDGMDGLAAVPSILVFVVLAVFAYVIGDSESATYLQFFPYVERGQMINHSLNGAGELAVLCCAGAGACAGFLWYNAFPATVMMGDTGALGLGALLGSAAVLIRQEGVFLIAGGVFILELGSSFIQDYVGLKLLGRRIFFRAPFHSSMLHRGISENKVTVRMWILSAALAVAALSMLKLR